MEGSYTISNTPIKAESALLAPVPGPSNVSDAAVHSCSAPIPYPSSSQPPAPAPPTRASLRATILKCTCSEKPPTTLELLSLMDAYDPAPDLKYVDIHSELCDHGLDDTIKIHSLDVSLLVSMGYLGIDGATRLHRFAREKLLGPLGYLKTRARTSSSVVEITAEDITGVEEADSSVVEVAREGVVKEGSVSDNVHDTDGNWPILTQDVQDAIVQWQEEVGQAEDNVEVVDEWPFDLDDSDGENEAYEED